MSAKSGMLVGGLLSCYHCFPHQHHHCQNHYLSRIEYSEFEIQNICVPPSPLCSKMVNVTSQLRHMQADYIPNYRCQTYKYTLLHINPNLAFVCFSPPSPPPPLSGRRQFMPTSQSSHGLIPPCSHAIFMKCYLLHNSMYVM